MTQVSKFGQQANDKQNPGFDFIGVFANYIIPARIWVLHVIAIVAFLVLFQGVAQGEKLAPDHDALQGVHVNHADQLPLNGIGTQHGNKAASDPATHVDSVGAFALKPVAVQGKPVPNQQAQKKSDESESRAAEDAEEKLKHDVLLLSLYYLAMLIVGIAVGGGVAAFEGLWYLMLEAADNSLFYLESLFARGRSWVRNLSI